METIRDRDERKFQEFCRLGKILKMPTLEAFLEIMVVMPDGKVVHHHKQRSRSWVRNVYNKLFSELGAVNFTGAYGAGGLAAKDTGGTVKSVSCPFGFYYGVSMLTAGEGYIGPVASNISGIVVGSGVNAESFEDYALQTIIANGTGAGQLSYVLGEPYAVSYDAPTKVMTVVHGRYFNNNSAGVVSVNEVALYSKENTGGIWYGCNSRDKLGATVTIPASGQLKVTYTVQLTYPA